MEVRTDFDTNPKGRSGFELTQEDEWLGTSFVAFHNSQTATIDTPPHSRGTMRPSCCVNVPLEKQRAQGMPGARCARSRVCSVDKAHALVTTVTPETPGIPRAMVLTVYSVLSPVTGLFCHRRLADTLRET